MKTGLILSDEQKKVLPYILEFLVLGTLPAPTHPGK